MTFLGVIVLAAFIALSFQLWKVQRRWHWNGAYKALVAEQLAPLSNRVSAVEADYARFKAIMTALDGIAETTNLIHATFYRTSKSGQQYEIRIVPIATNTQPVH